MKQLFFRQLFLSLLFTGACVSLSQAQSNTFIGTPSGNQQMTGNDNTALGFQSFIANTSGASNTGVGAGALAANSIGGDNTAIGHVTLFKNISGSNNTALGAAAMQSSTAGDQNTSIGASSGLSNTGGNGNTFLGYQADAGSGDLVNASAIGSKARVCASNTMEFGNSQVSGWGFGTCPGANAILVGTNSSNGNGASLTEAGVWTNASSRSFKDRFHSLSGTEILSKIAALDVLGWYYKGTNEYHIGPVAEDFYSAFETGNQDDKEYSTKHISSVDPAGVALIGVKELKKENDELRNEISSLRKELDKIKAALKK